jgi:hypothetical protein
VYKCSFENLFRDRNLFLFALFLFHAAKIGKGWVEVKGKAKAEAEAEMGLWSRCFDTSASSVEPRLSNRHARRMIRKGVTLRLKLLDRIAGYDEIVPKLRQKGFQGDILQP